ANGLPVEPRYEFVAMRKGGERFDAQVSISYIELDEGDGPSKGGALGIMQDITERKAAETEVREREWVLSRAQEAGQIGMWFWNRLTDRMTVSDETYRILGVTPDQWGHTLDAYRAMIHPEDRGAFEMRRMVKREELGGRFADDYRIIRPDGSVRYVTHVGEFFYDDAGNLKGLIGILQDITDRKRYEAELREKEWMLTRAQEAAHIGTFYRDVHGKFLKWSDETYRIFGVNPGTFTPTIDGFANLVHPEDRPGYFASRQRAFQDGSPVAEELRIVRPDGKVRNVMLTAEVVPDNAGHAAGLMGIVQDITERKTNEGRLVQAQKLEAMGRLTAGVAHDFNNLLTIITGNLELIQRDLGENQSITPMLDTVMRATGRGADLIRQMSAFNRKRALQQRAMSPREAIDNLGRLIPRTLGEAIQVNTSVTPEPWDILSDPAQLESALLNMAINARDAMPNGGKLNLAARNVTLEPGDPQGGPGDFVLFTVEDTGSGIPPEVMDKIFEPFFTTKEQGKGTGLGLSMVFGFVQQCGGHMRVYSEVGIGTTFRLYFPRYVKGQAAKPEPAAPQAPKAAPLPRAQGPVLIVEDQAEIRTLAVSIFERMGYPTIVCPDAHAGLAALQRNPAISLVFSDVTLPGGKSGAELAADVLRLRPGVPVLLTSGFTEQAIDLNPLLERGVLFLEKPYQLSDVQAKVLQLLQRTPPRLN
ncbi:MAG TPA: PAS domain-containing protein, partial [bacterium]